MGVEGLVVAVVAGVAGVAGAVGVAGLSGLSGLRARETRMSLTAGKEGLGDNSKALRGCTVAVEVDLAAKLY